MKTRKHNKKIDIKYSNIALREAIRITLDGMIPPAVSMKVLLKELHEIRPSSGWSKDRVLKALRELEKDGLVVLEKRGEQYLFKTVDKAG